MNFLLIHVKVLTRQVPSSDFQLEPNKKYFSADESHYLIFSSKEGNLSLRNATDSNRIVWQALNVDIDYVGNTAFLQSNGNLVIYDSNQNSLWTSVQDLLQVCQGNCQGDENCGPGFICYEQSLRRRLSEVSKHVPFFNIWNRIKQLRFFLFL